MERLTERWGEDDVWVKEHDYVSAAHRPAAYEDTGLTPGDVEELIKMATSKTNKVLQLKEELHAIKNELCQYCGKYKKKHTRAPVTGADGGICDGCG